MDLSNREIIFIWILIINLIVSLVYLLVNILVVLPSKAAVRDKSKEKQYDGSLAYIMRTVVMLLCPVIGPLFFLCGHICYLLLFRNDPDLEDVIFSKDRIDARQMADEDRERDIIPLEEAVLVNENKDLRSVMMNVLRGDITDSLASISLALSSEDSEVSHYAASVLSRELNQYRINVQKVWKQLQEEPEETEYAEMLIDYMDSILKQHILSPAEQRDYVGILDNAAEMLYESDPSKMTVGRYEAVCLRLLELKEYDEAEKWAKRLAEAFPTELPAYTCRLKLYFIRQDRDAFFELLNRLKRSNVVIDNETLELIRVFG
ncbi:MAG: hypothetical protein HDQ87_01775 [Clostridia bacterium]|nr:hypothetical protein [Clostridia bacterium]